MLTHFFYGKLHFEENYHDDKIDIQEAIFESIFMPQYSSEYKSKNGGRNIKKSFLSKL